MKKSLLVSVLFALCGCIGLYDDMSQMVDMARCSVRVGVLSELHLSPPKSDKSFEQALRYFNERNVDAVVLAGDVTGDGNLAQRRSVKNIWDRVFPGGKRRDGQPVELIVVTGEKDNEKVFETAMDRPFESVYMRDVKGYAFIGANWKDASGVDAWALKPILAKVGQDKPFFYIQNLIPYGTCCPSESRPSAYDGGKVTYMLSKYPNAIAICGRSHTPLTDESAFWRGDFTCVNAGAFSFAQMRGLNGGVKGNVRHGLVISVYDNSVDIERIDFGQTPKRRGKGRQNDGVYVEKLGEDWCIERPIARGTRAETPAPQFWEDTRLMILPSEKVVSVRFPPVLAKHTGVRAYEYEVKVEGADDSNGLTRKGHSLACCMSEEREDKAVMCDFKRSELPKGAVRFIVTPIDAFGRRGKAITESVNLL